MVLDMLSYTRMVVVHIIAAFGRLQVLQNLTHVCYVFQEVAHSPYRVGYVVDVSLSLNWFWFWW